MRKSSTKLKKTSQRSQKNAPSLIEYYTHDPSLYPSNENRFYKTLNMHRANALLDAKKKISYSKNLSSTINNNNTNNMSKQSNQTKSTRYKTTKPIVDHSSQEKITSLLKHDSTSLEKMDLSQIEKNYQEMLNEKDVIISQLKSEIVVLKNMVMGKSKTKHNNLKQSFEKNEEIKLSGKIFSDRLSNYYTPKARHLFRTINTNFHVTQHLRQFSLLSPVNNRKGLLQSNTLKSPSNRQSTNMTKGNYGSFNNLKIDTNRHKGLLEIYSPKNKLRHSYENNMDDVPTILFNENDTIRLSKDHNRNGNSNSNNNYKSILEQLKQKTKNVLDHYYQMNIKRKTIEKDKTVS